MQLLLIKQVSPSPVREFSESLCPGRFDLGHTRSCFYLFSQPRASVDHIKRQLVIDVLIGRLFPLEVIRIEPADSACDCDGGYDRLERLSLGDVNLHAAAKLASGLLKGGLEMKRVKHDT